MKAKLDHMLKTLIFSFTELPVITLAFMLLLVVRICKDSSAMFPSKQHSLFIAQAALILFLHAVVYFVNNWHCCLRLSSLEK